MWVTGQAVTALARKPLPLAPVAPRALAPSRRPPRRDAGRDGAHDARTRGDAHGSGPAGRAASGRTGSPDGPRLAVAPAAAAAALAAAALGRRGRRRALRRSRAGRVAALTCSRSCSGRRARIGSRPHEDRRPEGDGRARAARGLVPDVVRRLRAPSTRSWSSPARASAAGAPDDAFAEAGATLGDPWGAEVVAKVAPPSDAEVGRSTASTVLVGFLAPLTNAERHRGDRRHRRDRARDGGDPAHQPRAVDGRAVLARRRSPATARC